MITKNNFVCERKCMSSSESPRTYSINANMSSIINNRELFLRTIILVNVTFPGKCIVNTLAAERMRLGEYKYINKAKHNLKFFFFKMLHVNMYDLYSIFSILQIDLNDVPIENLIWINL